MSCNFDGPSFSAPQFKLRRKRFSNFTWSVVYCLLAEPHAATQAFVSFHIHRNIIFRYSFMHDKNSD